MLVIPLTASTVAGGCAAQDTLMNHRDEFVTYIFTFDLLKFLVYQFLGPLSSRSASIKPLIHRFQTRSCTLGS
jgi:hypothetical protein